MDPREGGRHCARCDRVVVDLTALTRREAVALFEARGGDLCGYLAFDASGQPLHAPDPRPPLLGLAVAVALAACEPDAARTASDPPSAVALEPVVPVAPAQPGFVMQPIEPMPDGALSETPSEVTSAEGASDTPACERSPEEVALDDTSSTAATIVPTAEDRARERRKRARRAPIVHPHTAYAGFMMLLVDP